MSAVEENLAISSILEKSGNNEENDILEYCTPNYATNTSKLFSTKGNKKAVHLNSKGKIEQQPVQIYGYGTLILSITSPIIDQLDSINSHFQSRKDSEQLSKPYNQI